MHSQVPVPSVGIDIVDVEDSRLPRGGRMERFAARVLAEAERASVPFDLADRDGVGLWLFWAAKEAAFKAAVATATDPAARPSFQPSRFQVEFDAEPEWPPPPAMERMDWTMACRILHPGGIAEGWVGRSGPVVTAVALPDRQGSALVEVGIADTAEAGEGRDADGWRSELRARFTEREWRAIHSFPSAKVRLEARAKAAQVLEEQEEDMEVVVLEGATGRAPPVLLLREGPAPLGISLSHHGRFVAWALRKEATAGVQNSGR